MDIESARAKCRKLVALGVPPFGARTSLEADGYDAATVKQVMAEYLDLHRAAKSQGRLYRRLVGLAVFLISGGAFLYFMLIPHHGVHVVHYSLLIVSMLGLFNALLPY